MWDTKTTPNACGITLAVSRVWAPTPLGSQKHHAREVFLLSDMFVIQAWSPDQVHSICWCARACDWRIWRRTAGLFWVGLFCPICRVQRKYEVRWLGFKLLPVHWWVFWRFWMCVYTVLLHPLFPLRPYYLSGKNKHMFVHLCLTVQVSTLTTCLIALGTVAHKNKFLPKCNISYCKCMYIYT